MITAYMTTNTDFDTRSRARQVIGGRDALITALWRRFRGEGMAVTATLSKIAETCAAEHYNATTEQGVRKILYRLGEYEPQRKRIVKSE